MSIKVIGVSGQTGAGKTTIAKTLSRLINAEYIDVDSLGHKVLKLSDTIEKLVEAFGADILTDSQIDRIKLGAKAFESSEATEKLNSIMHPQMVKIVHSLIKDYENNNKKSVVVDCALLYKMKLDSLCDIILYVRANPEVRLKRLVSSRGWTEQRARDRLFSQDAEPANDPKVTFIENNGNDISEIENKVKAIGYRG